eukprot:g8479.t1
MTCLSVGFVVPVKPRATATVAAGANTAPQGNLKGEFAGSVYGVALVATAAGVLKVLARPKRSKIAARSTAFQASAGSVTMEEVKGAQRAWADAIKRISKCYLEGGDYVAMAGQAAGELYGYGHGKVLFKPTKAADVQFRPEAGQAMSYFVGADAVPDGIPEDHGFAINGGQGWSDVLFDNHQIDLNGDVAIAMGNYFFASAKDGSISKVEYTFGYRKCQDGKVRICLHHSSIPYQGGVKAAPAAAGSEGFAAPAPAPAASAPVPVAAAFVGSSAQSGAPVHHSVGFAYSVQKESSADVSFFPVKEAKHRKQHLIWLTILIWLTWRPAKDAYVDLTFGNDVGYLPDGTPMNRAGNCINHPETIGPDPHAPGSVLPRALFVNDVGYLPDGTPLNTAGNNINHPDTWQRSFMNGSSCSVNSMIQAKARQESQRETNSQAINRKLVFAAKQRGLKHKAAAGLLFEFEPPTQLSGH